MKFKSKIDWWLHLVFAIMLIPNIHIIILLVLNGGNPIIAVILSVINIFLVIPIWLNTYYILDDDELRIRSGFCINMRIPYSDIKSIKETRDPTASAGLSLDRIEIKYSKWGMVLISPKNKQNFITQLNQRII
jgi:membrane protein YdbS with pleckstrin-like domain